MRDSETFAHRPTFQKGSQVSESNKGLPAIPGANPLKTSADSDYRCKGMSSQDRPSLGSPLLSDEHQPELVSHHRSSVTEAPRGLIQYEREHSDLYKTGAHWMQVGIINMYCHLSG